MALKTAYNDQTKETLVLQGDAWVKADQVAKNDKGGSAYLVGGNWIQDEAKPGATNRTGAKATLAPAPASAQEPGIWDRFKRLAFSSPESMAAERPDASPRAVAQAGTDAAGGLASAATAPVGALAGGLNLMHGVMQGDNAQTLMDQFQAGQKTFTYQPRTEGAQKVAEGAGAVLGAPGAALHYGGEKIFEATGSPGLATGFETVGNAAMMLAPGMKGGKAAAAEAPASAGLKPAPMPEFSPEVHARAQAFAEKAGIPWASAADAFKEKLTHIAQDAGNLQKLDPKAVARVARAMKIKAPINRGQATRNLVQITDEENVTRADAGKDIRRRNAQQDTALHDELTRIREGVAPQVGARDAGDVGASLQGAGRRKFQVLKADYGRKYAEAEAAGELQQPVNPSKLSQWLEADPANKALVGWIGDRIKAYSEKAGGLTLKNMEALRGEISEATGESGRKGGAAGRALRVADEIMGEAGGEKYQRARAAYAAVQEEFKSQGAIRDLTTEKAGTTDRRIALEDTLGRVIRGSNESLEAIKTTLTRGGTAATRQRGARAWKDLQAGVIEHLREAAAGKRKIEGEDSQLQFSSSFLDELHRLEQGGKIETLFGKAAANEIRQLGESVRDLRTKPSDRVVGPQTAMRLFRMLEHVAGFPGVKQVVEHVHNRATVKRAAGNPVEDLAPTKPQTAKSPPKTKAALKRAAPAVLAPQTYQGDSP